MSADLYVGAHVRVWRGVRPGRSQEAIVLGPVTTMGGREVVPVRLENGRTDHIALTHVQRILLDTGVIGPEVAS